MAPVPAVACAAPGGPLPAPGFDVISGSASPGLPPPPPSPTPPARATRAKFGKGKRSRSPRRANGGGLLRQSLPGQARAGTRARVHAHACLSACTRVCAGDAAGGSAGRQHPRVCKQLRSWRPPGSPTPLALQGGVPPSGPLPVALSQFTEFGGPGGAEGAAGLVARGAGWVWDRPGPEAQQRHSAVRHGVAWHRAVWHSTIWHSAL